jgi:formylglycine-generating enzyme required for sulfatase activity
LRELANVSNWLRRQSLGEQWSRRYGYHWEEFKAFKSRSLRRGVARAASLSVGLICLVFASAGGAWWFEDDVRFRFKQIFYIRPFFVSQIQPHVLTKADEEALQPFSTFVECGSVSMCPEMIVVPPGPFQMGSNDGPPNEQPPHLVEIKQRFAVSKYELTHAQWAACVNYGWCKPAYDSSMGRDKRPVINISWDDALEYLGWLSQMTGAEYRLLSESEWEYVARAGTTTPYYWDSGQQIGVGHANCAQCGNGAADDVGTLPVGQFAPNQFGLCDTRGNVWEFTADMALYYDGAPNDGSVAWTEPDVNRRVVRGGAWNSNPKNLTASFRLFVAPGERNPAIGVRVARKLAASAESETKPISGNAMMDRRNTCEVRPDESKQ